MRDIAKNIRDLRQAQNMTQEELAEKLFVTRQTVSNYETGRTRPDLDMLISIARTLGTDISTVIYGPPDATERERKLRRLLLTAAGLAVMAAVYWYLAGIAEEARVKDYELGLSLAVSLLLAPLFYGLLGWTVAEAAMVFAGLKPLRGRGAKAACLVLGLLAGCYLLFLVIWLLDIGWMRWFVNGVVRLFLSLRGLVSFQICGIVAGGTLRLILPEAARE